MTATADMLLADALRLSVEERSHIATVLIESLDDDADFELSPAWTLEIARRMESIRDGTAELIPHDEVMASVRLKLARQREAKAS